MDLRELDPHTAPDALLDRIVEVERAVVALEDPTAPAPVAEDVVGLLRHGWGLARQQHAALHDDGRLVGYATGAMRDHDNTHVVEVGLRVDPPARQRGGGRLLLGWASDLARGEGRRLLTGGTPREGAGRGFALAVGAEEALVLARNLGRLDDVPPAVLALGAPEGYELVRFAGSCPEALVDGYAAVKAGMNDAPQQALQWEDEHWDAEHVRSYLAAYALRRRTLLAVVARHLTTGELAGLTEVAVNDLCPVRAEQEDTIVLAAHRGHGLGLALKADMARWLRTEHPGVAEVETWNADDNRSVLAVNTRLGYRTADEWVEWQLPVRAGADPAAANLAR